MSRKNSFRIMVFVSLMMIAFCFVACHTAMAQTWQAMPPYNFLWPLWSSALSPLDAVTGLRTPIVSSLSPSTVLSKQPGLAWNPAVGYPYFLYNSPVGMQYYDAVYGINAWPPQYALNATTGAAQPISLPFLYWAYPASNPFWLQQYLPIANLAYIAEYPSLALAAYNSGLPANLTGLDPWLASATYPTPAFSSLLTLAEILGL